LKILKLENAFQQLVHGDRNEVIPLEDPVRIYRMIPNSEFAIIAGANHGSVISQAERVSNVVLDYIKRLDDKIEQKILLL